MTKHPLKTIITLAVTLLIGLCLGALICYGTIGTDTPVPGQSQATPRKGTAMQHANQQEPTFAKPGHTGKGTRKVFLNASQNAEGNTSTLAKELMGGEDYRQINLSEYRIPQVGQGDGDFPKVWDQLKGTDVIVIGTPVYWSNMSGYLKTFIDHVEVNEDLKGADLYLIVQGADSNQTRAANATYGTMDRVAKRFGLNLVGIAQNGDQAKDLHARMLAE